MDTNKYNIVPFDDLRDIVDLNNAIDHGDIEVNSVLIKLFVGRNILSELLLLNNDINVEELLCINSVDTFMPIEEVRNQIINLAFIHKHAIVNTVHLYCILNSSNSVIVNMYLLRIAELYKSVYPYGTSIDNAVIDMFEEEADNDNIRETINRMRRSIKNTPYTEENISERINSYLTSPYYPYSEHNYAKYQREKQNINALERSSIMLHFYIHDKYRLCP